MMDGMIENGTWSDQDDTIAGSSFVSLVLELAKMLNGIILLIGLCGNSFVIYVVLRFSKMKTVTNMYIFNLAIADEMFLVGLPFLIATMMYKAWPFGPVTCKLFLSTTAINQFTSSLLLTVMSADRYLAVCHPSRSKRYRTPFVAKVICITAWAFSALLVVPVLMYATVQEHGGTSSCNVYWPYSESMSGQKAFTLYSLIIGFFIPFVLILLFYVLVICKVSAVDPNSVSSDHMNSHRKVTILVLAVISARVMCWLPYWIGQVYITFFPSTQSLGHSEMKITFIILASCLSYANTAITPILYGFLSETFKKSFAKVFACSAD